MNNKGYLLVEIIVASVIAMSMMYFLLEITIKLKNINEDYYVETKLETDQILMLKDVMKDLSDNTLLGVSVDEKKVIFNFIDSSNNEFNTKISIEDNIYKYGKVDSAFDYLGDEYTKSFDNNLNVSNTKIENLCYHENEYKDCNGLDTSTVSKGLLKINIPATTIYSDTDYGIKLVIPYSIQEISINIKPPKGPSKFYYMSSEYSSQGNPTVSMNIVKCDEDFNNCNSLVTASGMSTTTTTALSPGLGANSKYLYYSSCRWGNTKTIEEMDIYVREDNSSSSSNFGSPVGYAYASYNLSISSEIISNEEYVYYTSASQSTSGLYLPKMKLYVCNKDGTNCNNPVTLSVFTKSGNSNANGNGVSFAPAIAVNDKYFYYTTANYSSQGNTQTSSELYRCNIDVTDCVDIKTVYGISNASGSEIYPKIYTDNDNLFYTSSDSSGMELYKCDIDGNNCSKYKTLYPYTSTKGSSIMPSVDINSKYIYYTTSSSGNTMNLYRCNRNEDSSSCKNMKTVYNTTLWGPGIAPSVTANENFVYYTSANLNSSGTERIHEFSLYKCDIEMSNCSYNGVVKGFVNQNGSVIPYKILLTK